MMRTNYENIVNEAVNPCTIVYWIPNTRNPDFLF